MKCSQSFSRLSIRRTLNKVDTAMKWTLIQGTNGITEPKYHYVCRYGGFYGGEFKFSGPNTGNFIVYSFLDVFRVPCGLLGLKIPKLPFLPKKTFFGAYILIELLNLTFLKFKGKYVVICMQYKLRIFDLAKLLVWGPWWHFRAKSGPGDAKVT